jgi:hypothetical protein
MGEDSRGTRRRERKIRIRVSDERSKGVTVESNFWRECDRVGSL